MSVAASILKEIKKESEDPIQSGHTQHLEAKDRKNIGQMVLKLILVDPKHFLEDTNNSKEGRLTPDLVLITKVLITH